MMIGSTRGRHSPPFITHHATRPQGRCHLIVGRRVDQVLDHFDFGGYDTSPGQDEPAAVQESPQVKSEAVGQRARGIEQQAHDPAEDLIGVRVVPRTVVTLSAVVMLRDLPRPTRPGRGGMPCTPATSRDPSISIHGFR